MFIKQPKAVSLARARFIERRRAEAGIIDRMPASVAVAICMTISFLFWGTVLKACS